MSNKPEALIHARLPESVDENDDSEAKTRGFFEHFEDLFDDWLAEIA